MFTAPKISSSAVDNANFQASNSIFIVCNDEIKDPFNFDIFYLTLVTIEMIHTYKEVTNLVDHKSKSDDRYFRGLLIDTGVAGNSTIEIGQVKTLQRLQKELQIDNSKAGAAKIMENGKGVFASLGNIVLETPIG